MRENAQNKGGVSLEVLQKSCESVRPAYVTRLFDDAEVKMITWHRLHDYQLVSLRLIAECMVRACTPQAQASSGGRLLYVPNEIGGKPLVFRRPVCVYASEHNPGARAFADELRSKYPNSGLTTTETPFAAMAVSETSSTDARPLSMQGAIEHLQVGVRGLTREVTQKSLFKELGLEQSQPEHMLLYLTKETFVGSSGTHLAAEVASAIAHGIPIVLIHEYDKSKGCVARCLTCAPDTTEKL